MSEAVASGQWSVISKILRTNDPGESGTVTNLGKVLHYRELIVWQKAMSLARNVYEVTGSFPSAERFGLVSQMRRSAVSIPSNIAEGQARRTPGDFAQFLSYAEGSLAELETQLLLSVELKFCAENAAEGHLELVSEVRGMLMALRKRLDTDH